MLPIEEGNGSVSQSFNTITTSLQKTSMDLLCKWFFPLSSRIVGGFFGRFCGFLGGGCGFFSSSFFLKSEIPIDKIKSDFRQEV